MQKVALRLELSINYQRAVRTPSKLMAAKAGGSLPRAFYCTFGAGYKLTLGE